MTEKIEAEWIIYFLYEKTGLHVSVHVENSTMWNDVIIPSHYISIAKPGTNTMCAKWGGFQVQGQLYANFKTAAFRVSSTCPMIWEVIWAAYFVGLSDPQPEKASLKHTETAYSLNNGERKGSET